MRNVRGFVAAYTARFRWIVPGVARAGPTRVGGNAAHRPGLPGRIRIRLPAAAVDVAAGLVGRQRLAQEEAAKVRAYQDPEEDEYEDSADESEEPPESPGTGWRKRANYDDIELGAELRGTVMKNPPSAG